jgi:hypothetical protein
MPHLLGQYLPSDRYFFMIRGSCRQIINGLGWELNAEKDLDYRNFPFTFRNWLLACHDMKWAESHMVLNKRKGKKEPRRSQWLKLRLKGNVWQEKSELWRMATPQPVEVTVAVRRRHTFALPGDNMFVQTFWLSLAGGHMVWLPSSVGSHDRHAKRTHTRGSSQVLVLLSTMPSKVKSL